MCTMLAAALGAAGTVYQGMAANSAAKAQAEAAEQNAKIAEAQGHDAIQRGGEEELRLRRQAAIRHGNAARHGGVGPVGRDKQKPVDRDNDERKS